MSEAKLVGGTAEDRQAILKLHDDYIDVNTRFDWENLQPIFSPSPEATFFNLNGHTYKGREHWTRLWRYYKDNVASGYWAPFDIGGAVNGDLAVIWCERQTRSEWEGSDPIPSRPYGKDFISRSTMVFRKEDGDWRVVHVHFSPASEAPRPGGV